MATNKSLNKLQRETDKNNIIFKRRCCICRKIFVTSSIYTNRCPTCLIIPTRSDLVSVKNFGCAKLVEKYRISSLYCHIWKLLYYYNLKNNPFVKKRILTLREFRQMVTDMLLYNLKRIMTKLSIKKNIYLEEYLQKEFRISI